MIDSVPPDVTVPTISSLVASTAEHRGRHGDDLGLELHSRWPQVGVERVGLRMEGVDLVEKVDVVIVAVIHGAQTPALPATWSLRPPPRRHVGENVPTARNRFAGEAAMDGDRWAVADSRSAPLRASPRTPPPRSGAPAGAASRCP